MYQNSRAKKVCRKMAAVVFCAGLLLAVQPVCAQESGGESEAVTSLAGTMSGNELFAGNGSNDSASMLFAKLQMELASTMKNGAMNDMKEMEAMQNNVRVLGTLRNKLSDFMEAIPEAKAVPLRDDLKTELVQSGICRAEMPLLQQNVTKKDVQMFIYMIDTRMDELSTNIQKLMVSVQDMLGSYNSYQQDVNNAMMSSYQNVQGLSKGGTMLDGNQGMLFTGLLIGALAGAGGVLLVQRAGKKKSMMELTFFAAAVAGIYGIFTCFRPKTPLFYKIVVYGFGSYLLGVVYSLLYTRLMPGIGGFHAGYLGYLGTYFFLFSSYFGAFDRLADGREKEYRAYRLAAVIPAAVVIFAGIMRWQRSGNLFQFLLILPVAGTSYYSCKHLIMPDVEMGIIRVMRPYNAVITVWCLLQPFILGMSGESLFGWILTVTNALAVILALPLAHKGVRQWFI